MVSAGSIDKTPFAGTAIFRSDWQLYFAKEFHGWGGKGVAFLRPSVAANDLPASQHANQFGALCRTYKISFEQFVDVVLQENGGRSNQTQRRQTLKSEVVNALQSIGTQGTAVLREGVLAEGWYRRLVNLGTHEDLPVLTFTTAEQPTFVPPAKSYLQTIAAGLMESWHGELSKDDLTNYLAACARWPADEVAALIDKASQ